MSTIRCWPAITNDKRWNSFLNAARHTSPRVVNIAQSEFEIMRKMYESSTQIQSSVEARTRHLTAGGLTISVGKTKSDATGRLQQLNTQFKSMVEVNEKYLVMHGLSLVARTKKMKPVVLNPELYDVGYAENQLGERIFKAIHRISNTSTNAVSNSISASVNAAAHSFDGGGIPGSEQIITLTHQGGVGNRQKGTKQKKDVAGGDSKGTDGKDSDSEDEGTGHANVATDAEIESFLDDDIDGIFVVEEHPPDQHGTLCPPIRSLRVYEAAKNTTLRQAQDASEHNCRPLILTVAMESSPIDRATQLSFLSPNDMDTVSANNVTNVESTAMQAFQRQRQESEAYRKMQDMQAQQASAQSAPRHDVVGRPELPLAQIEPYFYNIPTGRTAILGPKAENPPYLIDFLLHYGNEVGKILGVPAVLTGDVLNAVAVNQTVMFTFSGMIFERRTAHTRIIREFCRFFFGKEMKKLFMGTVNSVPKEKRTRSAVAQIAKAFEIDVSFHGLTDPLVINDLYAHGAIDEDTYCRSASAYTGLSLDSFTPERMKKIYDLKLDEMKIKATPPPPPAAAAAPKAAASSSGGDSKGSDAKTEYGKRSSANVGSSSKPSDLKQSVNGQLAKRGGVSTQSGAAAAKNHNPHPSSSKKQ